VPGCARRSLPDSGAEAPGHAAGSLASVGVGRDGRRAGGCRL